MIDLVLAGLAALRDYVATHVLTCLVPAFFLAGAMVTFLRKEAIVGYLGEDAPRARAFTLAAIFSFLVAACSCTVIPVASGLYYAGAGVGVAFIVLWVAPAANVLALTYTGGVLGSEMVVARVAAALLMAFVVGIVMTASFAGEDRRGPKGTPGMGVESVMQRQHVVLLVLIVVSLLAPNYLVTSGPYLAKVGVWAGCTVLVAAWARRALTRTDLEGWMSETWWFVRTILPLLFAGVFAVGVIGALLPEAMIRTYLGGNGLRASLGATLLGSVSYFATMTEAPFVDTLMKLGMGKGPALALLLTGPGISLPNWLAVAEVFGKKKAVVYVLTILVLGTLVGWFFGNFVLGGRS